MNSIENKILPQFTIFLSVDKGLTQATIDAYTQDISLFFHANNMLQLHPLTQTHLITFLNHLSQKNEAETTIARRLIALKVFFRFLQEFEFQKELPVIEHPKIWKRLPSILNIEDVNRLLAAPEKYTANSFVAYRDSAILHTLYSTGIRVSELCNLKLGDINDQFIRVTGKRSKSRLIPLGKVANKIIDDYLLNKRDKISQKYPNQNHLFVTQQGKPLTRSNVWKRVHFYGKMLFSDKVISPHSLRHAFATHLLDNHADLRVIQEMLGHSCISSTEIYTHISSDVILNKFHIFHPRNSSNS